MLTPVFNGKRGFGKESSQAVQPRPGRRLFLFAFKAIRSMMIVTAERLFSARKSTIIKEKDETYGR
jgi:hypothetical protein